MIRRTTASDEAHDLARVLRGAWRPSPPDPEFSEQQLSAVTPLLLGAGVGPLAWWKIRRSPLRDSNVGDELRRSYHTTAVHSALRERNIANVFQISHGTGIDPILLKGWAIARLYPEPGLRPLGDVDLCLPAGGELPWESAIQHPIARSVEIDLSHDLMGLLKGRSWTDLAQRSEHVNLCGSAIRVLSPEDQLAYLCIHFLKHGGWRPLWLCDVAVALETRSPHFDWDLCLGPDRTRADWIACTIGLAHALLDADVGGTPIERRAHHLPPWLVRTVLKEWEHPRISDHVVPHPITRSLRHPRQWPNALRSRWMSPIQSTVRVNGSFNLAPRLPYQVADYTLQLARLLPRLVTAAQYRRGFNSSARTRRP